VLPESARESRPVFLAGYRRRAGRRHLAIDSSRAENVGVLFVDVVGFTALAKNLAPGRVIAVLRSFYTRMSEHRVPLWRHRRQLYR
jgi:class 3 adenylate cyclase